MTRVLEGVKVGPLDPEATAEFGQVAGKNNARKLIRLHTRMYPPQLRQALALKLDPERTKALDLGEVTDYLRGLTFENGDEVLRDEAVVVGAQVRGERDRPQLLTFTYEVPTPGGGGRTAKWYAPYDADSLPESFGKGSEYVQIAELRERGLVAWDESGAQTQSLQRENAGLRRRADALAQQIEDRGDGEVPGDVEGDTRPDTAITEENQRLLVENRELSERLTRLEAALNAVPGGAQALLQGSGSLGDPGHEAAAEDEPVEGYDDMKPNDVIALARSEDTSAEQREQMLEYERRHKSRRTVVAALEAEGDKDRE